MDSKELDKQVKKKIGWILDTTKVAKEYCVHQMKTSYKGKIGTLEVKTSHPQGKFTSITTKYSKYEHPSHSVKIDKWYKLGKLVFRKKGRVADDDFVTKQRTHLRLEEKAEYATLLDKVDEDFREKLYEKQKWQAGLQEKLKKYEFGS